MKYTLVIQERTGTTNEYQTHSKADARRIIRRLADPGKRATLWKFGTFVCVYHGSPLGLR